MSIAEDESRPADSAGGWRGALSAIGRAGSADVGTHRGVSAGGTGRDADPLVEVGIRLAASAFNCGVGEREAELAVGVDRVAGETGRY